MDNEGPSFTIYQDPPEDQQHQQQQQPPADQPLQPSPRPVLAEIRLLSWRSEAHCDSALKHEMLIPQPEPSSSSSSLDTPPSSKSDEFKEKSPDACSEPYNTILHHDFSSDTITPAASDINQRTTTN
ncbi:hypothetical protein PSHT_16093 [Puccinia striiformis]|uniref:Uncharacterized protein n=1 Tax=Puccinia striiformis TaxID=27350 RepID=A0A2S4UBR9_9BASI|nr:hypothetical protein PSHT_16093 [Puccinia striiformis]